MRVTVLARAACQPGWPCGGRRGRPRPEKVIADLAAAVAPGGECLAAITVPRGQPELVGPVASDPAVNLVAGSREDTEALLDVTKPDGVLVSAASPGGEFPERDATVIFFSVRSDPVQLAHIVGGSKPAMFGSTLVTAALLPTPVSSTSRAKPARSAAASCSLRRGDPRARS
jgi:hypothetical protein